MYKKSLLSKFVILLCALVAGSVSAWAADVTVSWEASTGALGNTISAVNGTATGNISTGDFSWNYTRTLLYLKSGKSDFIQMSNGYMQVGSSNALESLSFTTSNISGIIKSVSVDCASKDGNHNLSITVGGTSYYNGATPSWSNNSGSTKTGTGNESGEINISFATSSNTSGNALYVKSISVTYETSSGPVDLTSFGFANSTPSVTLGEKTSTFEAEYTQTVTVDPAAYDGEISYSIDYEHSTYTDEEAVIDEESGLIEIILSANTPGTIVVKASGTATDAYNEPADATYTLTVNALDLRENANISYTLSTITKKTTECEGYVGQSLNNTKDLPVSYSLTGDPIGTINATTGELTLNGTVGTATITATFEGNDSYKPATASYDLVVYAPVVFTEFYESFDECDKTGGNDGVWGGITTGGTIGADKTGWAFEYGNAADRCARFGAGSSLGSATTPELKLDPYVAYVLTFKAAAWKANNEKETLKISATEAIFDGEDNCSVDIIKGRWSGFYIELTAGESTTKITFKGQQNSR